MSDDPGSFPLISILFYFLFVLGCGYFAGTEISLASVNRIRMMSLADEGDRRAARVLQLLDHFDEALSALLIGNNIMNIGCATLSVLIATKIWGEGLVSVATVVTTVVLFVFGEMIPKCFARSCNERFCLAVSGSLLVIMRLVKPLSFFFTALSRAVTAPFLKSAAPEITTTEDELHEIVENITEENGFDRETGDLVKSALAFDGQTVGRVMVPWDQVQTVRAGTKTAEILKLVKSTVHSRLPVVARDGSVKGILQIRNFMKRYIRNPRVILASVMDYPYFVRPETPIDEALTQMSNHRRNLAVVRDADGALLGIVTVEDILEELVGEIYDEDDIGGADRE